MRDVVRKMVEAEGEAERTVETARAEADRLLAEARRQAHEILECGRREARAEADQIVQKACDEAERERKERLAEAVAGIEAAVRLDEGARQAAAEAVVRRVCGRP